MRPPIRRNRADVQTDTPPDSAAFLRWFGNSKVVDAKGRPRVVYHGTADGGFVEFEHSKIDKHHSGFFFTSSKEVAESYGMPEPLPRRARTLPDLRTVADVKRFVNSPENDFDGWRIVLGQSQQIVEPEVEDYGLEYTGMGAQVVTRFFPFWARNGSTVDIGGDYYPPYTGLVSAVREAVRRGGPATGGVYPVYLRLLNPMVVEGRGALWSDIPFERGVYKTDQLSAIAKQRGYDGVIFRDIYDSMIAQDVVSDVYVAFDPRQIKSAVANVGTYDPESADIRMNPPRRNPTRRSPPIRRNTLAVQLREGHPSLRRTTAFVQEWNDRDMDRVFADMGARVDVSVGSGGAHDAVSLDSLEATTYRKGAGSRALRALLDLTDKHGLTVTLTAEPFSVRAFPDPDLISRDDLVRFYKRFGFDFDADEDEDEDEDDGFYPMVRYPRAPNPRRRNPADPDATLLMKHGGKRLRFSDLPLSAQRAVQHYADEVGWEGLDTTAWWYANLPTGLVTREVFARIAPGDKAKYGWRTFADYHRWYVARGDTPRHGARGRWPALLFGGGRASGDEFIMDGHHRLHSYVRAGASTIPVVLREGAVRNPARPAKSPKPPRTFRDLGAWTDWAHTQGVTLRLSRVGYGPVEVTDLYADVVGTGAGSRVMEALVAVADQQGMPLRLTPSGKRNITFYERFGFKVGSAAYDTAMHRTPRRR